MYDGLGRALYNQEKDAAASVAYGKASSLNPQAGSALNGLGYADLRQGKADEAIDAFKRYASAMPNEPNPQDSLAEALMAGGRLTEAEAGFRKAAEMSQGFWNAWEGVAYSKFFADDWAGGREAIGKARAAAPRPADRIASDEMSAWASLAERKIPEALKTLDAAEKSADAQPADVATVNLDRAPDQATQLGDDLGEDLGVEVDVGIGGGGCHERHVVERREQDAPVGQRQVQELLDVVVAGRGRLGARARRGSGEAVLGAGAELHDAPRQVVAVERRPARRR